MLLGVLNVDFLRVYCVQTANVCFGPLFRQLVESSAQADVCGGIHSEQIHLQISIYWPCVQIHARWQVSLLWFGMIIIAATEPPYTPIQGGSMYVLKWVPPAWQILSPTFFVVTSSYLSIQCMYREQMCAEISHWDDSTANAVSFTCNSLLVHCCFKRGKMSIFRYYIAVYGGFILT